MREKIAVWGFGFAGKRFYQMISQDYSDKYEITAVFDQAWKEKEHEKIEIQDPAAIHEMYTNGIFSSVAVCVMDLSAAREIKNKLIEADTRVFNMPENVFLDSSSFNVDAQDDQENLPEGYRHLILHNIYGAEFGPNCGFFMFDKDKRLNRDYLYDHQIIDMDLRNLMIPFSRKELECAVFMAGEYCMLAKIYNGNYWHFSYEALDQVYLLEKHGFSGKYILPHTDFAEELMQLMGIDTETRIIWPDDLPSNKVFLFEYVHLYTLGKDKLKISAPVLCEYSNFITQKLTNSDRPEQDEYPERIFVKRIGTRKLIINNNWLDQHGFKTIIPEELTIVKQIRYFMNAKIVLSPHGANSTNVLYMKPGTVFIETFPNTYYNALNFEVLYLKKVFYLPVIKNPVIIDDRNNNRNVDYQISENMLNNAVRIAEKILERKG